MRLPVLHHDANGRDCDPDPDAGLRHPATSPTTSPQAQSPWTP